MILKTEIEAYLADSSPDPGAEEVSVSVVIGVDNKDEPN